MGLVQIDPLWFACVLLRLQYEVFCFALVISFFFEVPFLPSFCQVSAFEEIAREANSV